MIEGMNDFAAPLIDLSIIVASILIFGSLYMRRRPATSTSAMVKILILGGLGLIVAVHMLDLVLSVVLPSTTEQSGAHVLSGALPEWLHWLASRVAFCMMAVGVLLTVMVNRDDANMH